MYVIRKRCKTPFIYKKKKKYFLYIRMCERKLLNNNIMTLRLRFILLKIMRIFFQSKRIKNVGRSENY